MLRSWFGLLAAACVVAALIPAAPTAEKLQPPPAEETTLLSEDPPAHEQGPVQPPAPVNLNRFFSPALSPELLRRGGYQSVQVNLDELGFNIVGDAANEPSLAVDPTNPNRLAIGWRQFDTIGSNFREAGWAYSQDAGRTWTFPGVLVENDFRTDPVLDADTLGNFYYQSLVGTALRACDVSKSVDGGASWLAPVPASGGDKNWMVVDRSDSIGQDNVYCVWRKDWSCCGPNIFTRSTDHGETYIDPSPCPPARPSAPWRPGRRASSISPAHRSLTSRSSWCPSPATPAIRP